MKVKANLLLIIYYQLASSYAVMEVWLSVTLMQLKPLSWGFKGSFQISKKNLQSMMQKKYYYVVSFVFLASLEKWCKYFVLIYVIYIFLVR